MQGIVITLSILVAAASASGVGLYAKGAYVAGKGYYAGKVDLINRWGVLLLRYNVF